MVMAKPDFLVNEPEALRRILRDARTVAVVGMSSRGGRASLGVGRTLVAFGYDVIPVNPNEREVLGLPAVPNLRSIERPIDVVDVFRRSELVDPHVDEAIAVAAKVLWLQDGVIAPDAARRAHAAGLSVVMDRCMARDLASFGLAPKSR
jgi:predicted CoA-binding protein